MFKMKHREVSSVDFTMTIQKLAASPMNPQAAYRVKKLVDKVNQAKKKVSELYKQEIAQAFGKKTDKGEIIPDDNTVHGFELAEGKTNEDVASAMTDFHEREVTVEREPLTLQDIASVQLTPAEIHALGPCLKDPEDEESESSPTPNNVVKMG